MLILEDLEHASARGARIYAELAGFATNSMAYMPPNPGTHDAGGHGAGA